MKTMKLLKRLTSLRGDESGSMAMVVAILLVVLLGMAALAVDYGHMAWVQYELQKAADSGALAGARYLVPYIGTPGTPNWIVAESKARERVLSNSADGEALTDCEVQSGYWSLSTKTFQSSGIIPTATDVPAIQVKVTKTAGENGGPLTLLFAPILGVSQEDLSGQAVAMISGPSHIPPHGNAFPVAIPKYLADRWNEEPYPEIYIGSSYHDPTGGQWTSFLIEANNVPTIRDLIDSGNPSSLTIGDNIWIEPGTETTLYNDAATKIGQTVILPVVETDFSTQAYTPILGFASFYIETVAGGSDKYIQGHFVKQIIDNADSGGPVYGTFLPTARLVN